MPLHRLIPLMFVALRLPAATLLDVSSQSTITLNPGDSLRFTIYNRNFVANATALRLSADATGVSFDLLSDSLTEAGPFTAFLASSDGSVSLSQGPLDFVTGSLDSSRYDGVVSVLSGSFSFSQETSSELFDGGSALLTLLYGGPAVTLGLSSSTLRKDFQATLSGGPLSVGAVQSSVAYIEPQETMAEVPEPHSSLLLAGGGMALWLLSSMPRSRTPRA